MSTEEITFFDDNFDSFSHFDNNVCPYVNRKFRYMDNDGNKTLSKEEFVKGCMECITGRDKKRPKMTVEELELLFDLFDKDKSGALEYEEFLFAIRVSYCLCMNACTRVAMHAYIHTCLHVYIHTEIHTNAHAYKPTYMHTFFCPRVYLSIYLSFCSSVCRCLSVYHLSI